MDLPNWPEQLPQCSHPLDEKLVLPQVRTEFESGEVQSRPKATKARRVWTLVWEFLPEPDFQILAAFFTAHQGGKFLWPHPLSGEETVCRFSGDELGSSVICPGYRRAQCLIEEG